MVEHSAVNRVVVGSSPTRGVGMAVRETGETSEKRTGRCREGQAEQPVRNRDAWPGRGEKKATAPWSSG